jgi:hypothetical protein
MILNKEVVDDKICQVEVKGVDLQIQVKVVMDRGKPMVVS